MLMPKKSQHRKEFKGKIKGVAPRGFELSFGQFGLKAEQADRLTARQIEAARRAMTRYVKRGGKIWINVFPHTPVTKKPNEVKMGGGKGSLEHYAARVHPGRVLFEMDGVEEDVAREAMRLASHKLPVKTKFIVRHTPGEKEE